MCTSCYQALTFLGICERSIFACSMHLFLDSKTAWLVSVEINTEDCDDDDDDGGDDDDGDDDGNGDGGDDDDETAKILEPFWLLKKLLKLILTRFKLLMFRSLKNLYHLTIFAVLLDVSKSQTISLEMVVSCATLLQLPMAVGPVLINCDLMKS